MNPAPTLIDMLYRATFSNKPDVWWRDNSVIRKHLIEARPFMLDDNMSVFLGDISSAGFIGSWSAGLGSRLCEQMRVSARLPHRNVWIEYDLRKSMGRTADLFNWQTDIEQMPEREGWLLQQHPTLSTAISMHVFSYGPNLIERPFMFPVMYTWTVDSSPSPWPSIAPPDSPDFGKDAAIGTGVKPYRSASVSITPSPFINKPLDANGTEIAFKLSIEWMGVMRRAWSLLATINDIPMTLTNVRQSRHFVAKGAYRKYLDHQTITLNIPARQDTRTLARKLIAAARRRAHDVRGHWRRDWHNLGDTTCKHEWNVEQQCVLCLGRRIWIPPHRRGDESLGFVSHDYQVKHDV